LNGESGMSDLVRSQIPDIASIVATDESHDSRVIAALSALGIGQMYIAERLDKINGSVAQLEEKTSKMEREQLEHPVTCPQLVLIKSTAEHVMALDKDLLAGRHPGSVRVNERVTALEQQQAIYLAAKNATERVETRASNKKAELMSKLGYPVIKIAVTLFLFLIALHFYDLLKVKAIPLP
jgi:hypothetical protein